MVGFKILLDCGLDGLGSTSWLGWKFGWGSDLARLDIALSFRFGWIVDLVGLDWAGMEIWLSWASWYFVALKIH